MPTWILQNLGTEVEYVEKKEQKIVSAESDGRSIEIRQAALTKNPTIIQ